MQIPIRIITPPKMNNEAVDFDKLIIKVKMAKTFDIKTGKEWSTFLKTIIQGGLDKILIDMSELNHIESSSIGILIHLAKLIRLQKGDIIFLNVPRDIEDIFKMVHLHRFIKFYENEEEAIKFFRVFV